MAKKQQSKRLTNQHVKTHGVVGIFGEEAKSHDLEVSNTSHKVKELLEKNILY